MVSGGSVLQIRINVRISLYYMQGHDYMDFVRNVQSI